MTPKEMRTQWSAALRSGNYEQGKNGLYDKAKKTYCCLGVACELFAKKVDGESYSGNWQSYIYLEDDVGYTATLPRSLRVVLGVDSTIEAKLVTMNDDGDKTFDQIADYIDALEDA